MDRKADELKDGLLAQQMPDPERLAAYRKGVETMLEQLRRERWWVGLAHAFLVVLGVVALFFGALVLGVIGLYLAAGQGGLTGASMPLLGGLLCLFGAVALLRHFTKRNRTRDLLLEVKRLEMKVLDLEESQRRRPEV